MKKRTLPIYLNEMEITKIDQIAEARERSRSFILREWINEKIKEQYPKIDEIKKYRKEKK